MIIGRRVIHLSETTSTMDEIDRLAAEGEAEGFVVVADHQSRGRGRAGRSWLSASYFGLLFSFLLRPQKSATEFGAFPLVIGLAISEAISQFAGIECRLKWPNDVLIHDRKVAGILMTTRLAGDQIDYANAGMGINVNTGPEDLPAGATSLRLELGEKADRTALLDRLLPTLDDYYAAFCSEGADRLLREWKNRAAYVNELVTIEDADRTVHGRLRGVDVQGSLLIEREDGSIERIVSGDLTRGPKPVSTNSPKMAN